MTDPVAYGRTTLGQLVYDLLFTKLSDQYLARKHGMPVADLRSLRTRTRQAFRKGERHGKRSRSRPQITPRRRS